MLKCAGSNDDDGDFYRVCDRANSRNEKFRQFKILADYSFCLKSFVLTLALIYYL